MSGMTVPEEAVVAAANELHDREGYFTSLADAPAYRKAYFCEIARQTLEAAAPFIAAKAWDEGYNAGKRVMVELMSPTHFATEKPNPYRAAAVRGEG